MANHLTQSAAAVAMQARRERNAAAVAEGATLGTMVSATLDRTAARHGLAAITPGLIHSLVDVFAPLYPATKPGDAAAIEASLKRGRGFAA